MCLLSQSEAAQSRLRSDGHLSPDSVSNWLCRITSLSLRPLICRMVTKNRVVGRIKGPGAWHRGWTEDNNTTIVITLASCPYTTSPLRMLSAKCFLKRSRSGICILIPRSQGRGWRLRKGSCFPGASWLVRGKTGLKARSARRQPQCSLAHAPLWKHECT